MVACLATRTLNLALDPVDTRLKAPTFLKQCNVIHTTLPNQKYSQLRHVVSQQLCLNVCNLNICFLVPRNTLSSDTENQLHQFRLE